MPRVAIWVYCVAGHSKGTNCEEVNQSCGRVLVAGPQLGADPVPGARHHHRLDSVDLREMGCQSWNSYFAWSPSPPCRLIARPFLVDHISTESPAAAATIDAVRMPNLAVS